MIMGAVSKLFRAYRLYNKYPVCNSDSKCSSFQSSFELTGYITNKFLAKKEMVKMFQSSFELTGYITNALWKVHEY